MLRPQGSDCHLWGLIRQPLQGENHFVRDICQRLAGLLRLAVPLIKGHLIESLEFVDRRD
jgi:hypothetical protein